MCPGCGDSATRAQGCQGPAQALLVLTGARGLAAVPAPFQASSQHCEGLALRLKPPGIPEHPDIGKCSRVSLGKARTQPFQPFTFSTPSLPITRSIHSSPKYSQHQHTFKPYYFSSQGLNTACIKLLHYFPLPGSLSWLSHVFPGSKPSCSWKPCSKHMFLHGMFIIIFSFILLVHVLPVCPQRAAFSRVWTKLFDWLQASL